MGRKFASMRTIIALDLGSVTGFAVKSKHGFSHGTMSFKVKGKFHDSGYKKLYDWLRGFEEDVEIVVECPHAGRFFGAVKILFGLLAIVHLFAYEYKAQLTEVKPTAIKKFWTGSGNADKETMVLETQKKFPNVTDHNTSDAIALLHLYLEQK
jgi:Holliday junction resolvasome RuvABC endonuclease subunit